MINNSLSFFFFFIIKMILLFNVMMVVMTSSTLMMGNYFGNISAVKDKNIMTFLKNVLVCNLLVNLFLILLYLYLTIFFYKMFYIDVLMNSCKHNLANLTYTMWFYTFDFDVLNSLFYSLSLIVGFISFLALDTRLYSSKVMFLVACNFLMLMIFMFSFTSNFILFFMFYELLLIPSFFFVYSMSPAKTAMQSSIYFVMWTQIGSFLVFLAILYCVILTSNYTFSNLTIFNFTKNEISIIQYLLFFGFGMKMPIWPFHYWITKTHVDAPTGFSIFLSGFLVKTALFGFYKFNISLGFFDNTTLFTTMCLLGMMDASLKMWAQTDLKKLVAYATMQEMGLMYVTMFFGDTDAMMGGFMFSVTHALLSSIFFFLVDTVSSSFYTRNMVEMNGILHLAPNLGIAMLLSCIFFSGLPGTLKFMSELYMFSGLLDIAPLSTIMVLFMANFFGLIGFSKVWFNVVFGMTAMNKNYMMNDLSYKEMYTLGICYVLLLFWGLMMPTFI